VIRWLILAVFLLPGCAAAPLVVTGLGVTGVVVNETTGKTVTDHAVSAANGQDCRVGRALKQEDICQSDSPVKLQITNTSTRPSSTQELQARYQTDK